MTTITTASASPTQTLQAAATAQGFVLAAGIMGRMLNPLGAGPWASAQLPSMWRAALFSNDQPQAQWTASTGAEVEPVVAIDRPRTPARTAGATCDSAPRTAWVSASNEEDGVAKAIERILLPEVARHRL